MVGNNELKRICKKAFITVNILEQGLRKRHKNLVRIAPTGLECSIFCIYSGILHSLILFSPRVWWQLKSRVQIQTCV